jgi:hypothetical protein
VALGLFAMTWLASDAKAVFTFSDLTTKRSITMQVGSSQYGTINSVNFTVNNTAVSPNPVPVTGVPSTTASTAATSPAGGTLVSLTAKMPGTTLVLLNVDSAAGLSCVGGSGCGTTIIPFNTISWTSYNHDPTYPAFDIQDGTFNGSSSQNLTAYYVSGGSVSMSNVLIFQYANTMLYPAGQYTGRVTFTASMP